MGIYLFDLYRYVPLESFASSVLNRLIYNLMLAYPKLGLISRKETEGCVFCPLHTTGS